MSVVSEIKKILDQKEESKSEYKSRAELNEEMLEKIKMLPPEDVAKIAIVLSERFPAISSNRVEADLPRVGEKINGVEVQKVERRVDTKNEAYWVVGMKSGDKVQTKKVSVAGGLYEVAWKEGERWNKRKVGPMELREELIKRIGQ